MDGTSTGAPASPLEDEVVTVPAPLLVVSASEAFEDDDRSGPLFPPA